MESIRSVKGLIQKDDWLTKLDLKDACLMVPVHPCHQKYLRFRWQDQLWQFVVLPFGLNSAPFIFTKLMKPVVATLRKLGNRVILYLDNMLIMANSRDKARDHCQCAIYLLTSLGFVLNVEKSMWSPRQQIARVFRLQFRFQCNDYFTTITEADDLVENNKTSSREDTDIIERDIREQW